MTDRISRSQIQLATLQAAKAELDRLGQADIQNLTGNERESFVQQVQRATPGMPAAEVRDVLQAEWMKGNESLLGQLQASRLESILGGGTSDASAQRPLDNGDGTFSPVGLRLQQQKSSGSAPFWHATTAEGPYSAD